GVQAATRPTRPARSSCSHSVWLRSKVSYMCLSSRRTDYTRTPILGSGGARDQGRWSRRAGASAPDPVTRRGEAWSRAPEVLLEGAYRWPAPTGPSRRERVMSPQGAQPVYRTHTEASPHAPAAARQL